MRRRIPVSALLALCATAAVADGEAAAAGLCTAPETTYFNCAVARGRTVSLCGAPSGPVQYRFGRSGAIELAYPPSGAPAASDALLFAHYSRYQTDRVEIRFDNGGTEYIVFDYHEGNRRSAGVRVTTPDAKERELKCSGRATSRVLELKPLLKCDADSALNGGACS